MIFAVIMIAVSAVSLMPATTQAAIPRDCDSNAIMRCGAETKDELNSKTKGDVVSIYSYYGISKADFGSLVEGTVYKDGRITVGNKVVATGAVSTGRQVIGNNSRKVNAGGVTIYERPTSTSFKRSSIAAFVKMKNGRFQYAIIKSCGNPTKGNPTPVPPTPAPAKPKIAINKEVSKAVVNVNEEFTYTISVRNSGTVNITNAGIKDVAPANVEFVPNSGTAGTTITKSVFTTETGPLKVGEVKKYTFKARFPKYVANAAVNKACVLTAQPNPVGDCDTATNKPKQPPVVPETPVTPETPETPEQPITPAAVIEELPSTGPAQVLVGAMGLSASTYGVTSYFRSRRSLKDLFKK